MTKALKTFYNSTGITAFGLFQQIESGETGYAQGSDYFCPKSSLKSHWVGKLCASSGNEPWRTSSA